MDAMCEEYPKYRNEIENKNPLVIQNELQWGISYRHIKKKEEGNKLIPSMEAPIDIPFELCRAKQKRKRRKTTSSQNQLASGPKIKKMSLLEKSVMSQSKYMEYLSTPNPKYEEPPTKKIKKRCEIEPCPPRFVQLAVPNKRRVFANWKDYHTILPTEMLLRFEKILHTDKNLEPRDARYYYKKIDKEKKKRARAKKRLMKKKKKMKERGDKVWLESYIDDSVKAILDFIKNEPLFSLNFKQVMLSDGILTKLDKNKILKKPRRNSRNYYKRTIIEVCDKLALWMDTLTKFVDVQVVDSKEDIPPLTISSLEEEEEGEDESEETSEGTSEGTSEVPTESAREEGDVTEATTDVELSEEEAMEEISPAKLWEYQEDEGDEYDFEASKEKGPLDEIFETLGDFGDDIDILEELIEMYENSPDEFLMSEVEGMPGVTHMNILNKLRELKGEIVGKGPKRSTLEEAMIEWAKEAAPEKVDDKMLKAIHEYACFLNEKLRPLLVTDDDAKNESVSFTVPQENDVIPEEGDEEKGEGDEGEGEGNEGEGEGDEEKGEGDERDVEGDEEEGEGEEKEVIEDIEREIVGEYMGGEDMGGEDEGKLGEEALDSEKEIGDVGENQSEYGEGEEGESKVEQDELGPIETDLNLAMFDKSSELERDEEIYTKDMEAEDYIPFEKAIEMPEEGIEGKKPKEIDVLYQAGVDEVPPTTEEVPPTVEEGPPTAMPEGEKVQLMKEEALVVGEEDDRVIKGHKPAVVVEHSPNTVCCLSLKIWAVWLLEITHNAHTWTKWVHEVIKQVREFAAIVRGDVKLPNGEPKILYKKDWRKFTRDTEEKIIAWRKYSAHVKNLSNNIIDNFHLKKVNCCPKCLQDHLIKNVVTAHETFQALTEAMNCAGYWQKCLDNLVQQTTELTDLDEDDSSHEESDGEMVLEELEIKKEDSDESIYEIEELDPNVYTFRPNR